MRETGVGHQPRDADRFDAVEQAQGMDGSRQGLEL